MSAPGGQWPPQPGVVYQAPLTGYAPPPGAMPPIHPMTPQVAPPAAYAPPPTGYVAPTAPPVVTAPFAPVHPAAYDAELAARAAIAEAAIRGAQSFVVERLDRTPFRRGCEVWGCEALAYRSRVPEDDEFPYLFTCENGHEIPSEPDWA